MKELKVHNFKISTKNKDLLSTPSNMVVELDGNPLHFVQSISFKTSVGKLTTVKIEMAANVEVYTSLTGPVMQDGIDDLIRANPAIALTSTNQYIRERAQKILKEEE